VNTCKGGEYVEKRLSEQEMLDLVKTLKKLEDNLELGDDSNALTELINYLEAQLKEIAWDHYCAENKIPDC